MPTVRVIRFARIDPAVAPLADGAVAIAQVLLEEPAVSAGLIVRHEGAWKYRLADGSFSGLSSRESRQDLEAQIYLYHRGALASPQIDPAPAKDASLTDAA